MRSGSVIWLSVAGPLAQLRPRDAGMLGIAFKLLNLAGDFVDVGEQPARRFAVEAGGGNERVVPLLALRPGLRIKLGPIVPALLWRKRREMTPARAGIESFVARKGFIAGRFGCLVFLRWVHFLVLLAAFSQLASFRRQLLFFVVAWGTSSPSKCSSSSPAGPLNANESGGGGPGG